MIIPIRGRAAFRIVLLAVLALAGCNREPVQPQLDENAASISPKPVAASQAAPVAADCAPSPKLELSQESFGEGFPKLAELRTNFGKAYGTACKAGWLKKKPLVDPLATHRDVLFVLNAPAANIASIYLNESEKGPAAERNMLLEAPFIGGEGKAYVPSTEDLREAIYCYVVGATEKEQEEDGRCLPD